MQNKEVIHSIQEQKEPNQLISVPAALTAGRGA